MPDPTAAAIRTRTDVIPDFILSEPGWLAHCGVEEELYRDYRAEYVAVAVRVDPARFQEAMEAAERKVDARPYAAMSDAYYERVVKRKDAITPFLVLACLKRDHPAIKMSTVEKFLMDDRFVAVQGAVMELFGFVAKKAGDAEEVKSAAAPAPSTSTASLEAFENVA